MSAWLRWGIVILASYLLGSIQFGLLISRGEHVDIRSQGSKSTGATNMFRVMGAKASVFTFLGDCLKGTLSALLGLWLLGNAGASVAAVLAILGHLFPVFEGFKGGKGVSTSIGAAFVLNPILCGALFLLSLVGVAFVRVVSVFSIVSLILFGLINPFLCGGEPFEIVCSVLMALLVVWAHRSNIRRIFDGTEMNNRLDFSKTAGRKKR